MGRKALISEHAICSGPNLWNPLITLRILFELQKSQANWIPCLIRRQNPLSLIKMQLHEHRKLIGSQLFFKRASPSAIQRAEAQLGRLFHVE